MNADDPPDPHGPPVPADSEPHTLTWRLIYQVAWQPSDASCGRQHSPDQPSTCESSA